MEDYQLVAVKDRRCQMKELVVATSVHQLVGIVL
jgi:hypothetical protein